MFFSSFFDPETSFLAYICIFGQIRKKCKKKFFTPQRRPFWGNFDQKLVEITRARLHSHNSVSLYSIRLFFGIVVLNNIFEKAFFLFLKKIKNENFIGSQIFFSKFTKFFDKFFCVWPPKIHNFQFFKKIKKGFWDLCLNTLHSKYLRNRTKIDWVMSV